MLQAGLVTALGTMSGTSLDGVDAAVVITDGVQIAGFGPTMYRPYRDDERAFLRAHLGCWQGDDVENAARFIEWAHWEAMYSLGRVDIGGFHGQTLAHDPGGRGTHQCGNGQNLADALGYPVVWDFRSADVAAGGQGAPLAPFYHFALAKWIKAEEPVVFLNLGGVGNLTWVDPSFDDPADEGALMAFDTGPANAPINDLMMQRRGVPFDTGGALAGIGKADLQVLEDFLQHPYFKKAPPKSLDRDDFAGLIDAVAELPDARAVATLTQAVVVSVWRAIAQCPAPPSRVLVTGGGRLNRTIMGGLAQALDCDVSVVERAGLSGDMLEAQAFAYLAVRAARGLPISAPASTGISQPATGGQVAFPRIE
ncbi:anhydro-N-acetylmuramic acid kinase [Yoonia sp. BS5-3]|uniref:Anhydro-N-acetylmuramic acid kinase n=1 Tax=Yoonia phaeophyticola TaxID=3137369 RepID=A0ABZ2V4S4_9RHOB